MLHTRTRRIDLEVKDNKYLCLKNYLHKNLYTPKLLVSVKHIVPKYLLSTLLLH